MKIYKRLGKKGLHTIDISLYKFKSFLYILKLTSHCNFLKRKEIYNNLLSLVSSSETNKSVLINHRRFDATTIGWDYVNQSYFRDRKDFDEELLLFYQVEGNIIRKFESYYGLKFQGIKLENSYFKSKLHYPVYSYFIRTKFNLQFNILLLNILLNK